MYFFSILLLFSNKCFFYQYSSTLKYRFSGLKFHDRTLNAHTSSMNLDAHTEFEEREWKEVRFDPFQLFRGYFLSSFTRGHPRRPKAEPRIRNSQVHRSFFQSNKFDHSRIVCFQDNSIFLRPTHRSTFEQVNASADAGQ